MRVTWKDLPPGTELGDIIESNGQYYRLQLDIGYTSREVLGLRWRHLCELPGCLMDADWHRGGKMICTYHLKYGTQYVLYRHYNSNGDLLYVGKTNDPRARARGHRSSSEFWSELTDGGYTSYERFASPEDLILGEKIAIAKEKPRYNKHYNGSDDDEV